MLMSTQEKRTSEEILFLGRGERTDDFVIRSANEPSTCIFAKATLRRRTVTITQAKEKGLSLRQSFFFGRGERTRTFDLTVPNRAR